jgi:hypothetical protein
MRKLIALAILRQRQEAKRLRRLVLVMALVGAHLAHLAAKIKTRHYLQRADLVPIRASPWYHLKTHPTDRAYLQLMGLTVESFHNLLTPFSAILSGLHELRRPQINRKGAGCKRVMDTQDVLALVLSWLHLPCTSVPLMLIFSIGPACLSRYLRDGKVPSKCVLKPACSGPTRIP